MSNVRITLAAIIALLSIQSLAIACTGLQLKTKDNAFVSGRTFEFGVEVDSSIAVVPRQYTFVGQTPLGQGMKYQSKYAVVGATASQDMDILDGINEKGLSAGTFYFPTFTEYTPVNTQNQNKALSPTDFSNWLLTQFATVNEVRQAIDSGKVVIAPTVVSVWGSTPPPFHYIVYDKSGASIVIEPIGGKLVVRDNPLGVFTNSPPFDWQMTNMRNYIALNPNNVSEVTWQGQSFKALGQGNGMVGLPGDFSPPSRFVRAAMFSINAIPVGNAEEGIQQVFHILNNFDIPVGVARSKENGMIYSDHTLLTMARDPQHLRYYYKSYEDQTVRMVQLDKFDLNAKTIKVLSTKGQQPVVDMSDKLQ